MSLDFDLTAVPKKVWQDDDGNQTVITSCLIWSGLMTHLGAITEDNVNEWEFRLRLITDLNRSILSREETKNKFLYEEIKAHVGLTTNCDNKTRKQWMTYIANCMESDVERQLLNEHKNREKADGIDASTQPVDG